MPLEEYRDIIHRCFRCGYCKFPSDYDGFICAAYNTFRMESYAPGGMLWLARAMMMNEIDMGSELSKILYSCTMCRNCADKCPMDFRDKIVEMLIAARYEALDRPGIPKPVKGYLENMMAAGNPWKKRPTQRGEWNRTNRFPAFTDQSDYLYFIGDIGAYTDEGMAVTTMLAEVLEKMQLNFGVLGDEEHSDGNDIQTMGEQELFEALAQQNIQLFNERGVKRICTLSPHAYHTIKNDYPQLNGRYDVAHYTSVLQEGIENHQLRFTNHFPHKVTFHDPCFLGRWNKEYDAPRRILESIPSLQLIEMSRTRRNALCCGGGGGNVYTDMLGNTEDSPARVRVREASACGAEVLAVSCPACRIMLREAVKSENLDQCIDVKDIIEIVYSVC